MSPPYDLYFTASPTANPRAPRVPLPSSTVSHGRFLLASPSLLFPLSAFLLLPHSHAPRYQQRLNECSFSFCLQCIILGEDVEPIFYRFETPEVYMTNKRTTIYRNQDEMVAVFDWSADTYLGLCSVRNRQPFPMVQLVLPGSDTNARAFYLNGAKFEWRRTRQDQLNYDLYHTPQNAQSVRIAFFRTIDQDTPLGPAHGFLQYTFVQPALLLEAILALSLNRWLDMNAM